MKRRVLLNTLLCLPFVSEAAADDAPFEPRASYDVVVVGAGAAGLAGALRAAQLGLSVLVVEAKSIVGGTATLSAGMFNAVRPKYQTPLGIEDSPELFLKQTLEAGEYKNDPSVVEAMVRNSGATMEWLENVGVHFDPSPFQIYGSPARRSFRPVSDRGANFVEVLYNRCKTLGVDFLLNAPFNRFITDARGEITGIVARQGQHDQVFEPAKGILLAAGGFVGNQRLLQKWAPQLADLSAEGASISLGSVLEAAIEQGLKTENMQYIECVPEGSLIRGNVRLSFTPESLIFVNESGNRFVDERSSRLVIQKAILKQRPSKIFAITSESYVHQMDLPTQKNLYKSLLLKEALGAYSIAELEKKLKVPSGVLQNAFHLPQAPKKPPYWAMEVFLKLHFSLGGLSITPEGRCLHNDGRVARKLWAAGQICGSVHGSNRLGGNGLCEAFVFGKLAAESILKLSGRG